MDEVKVVVVDENDRVIDAEYKDKVLQEGLIHRIVRVLLFNSKGQVFLQKRSSRKDVWPDKWDQSVGGHVDKGESYKKAVERELAEELGIEGVKLEKITKFYTESPTKGKLKKRFNMLYKGLYDGEVKINKQEISEGGWFDLRKVESWMVKKPDDFAPGCILSFRKYREVRN